MIIRYSMIDSFLECPKCFYRKYILNQKDNEISSAAEFGQAMHAAIRAHFEDMDAMTVFNLYWESLRHTEMKIYRYGWQDLKDLANHKFLPNFIKLHAKNFTNFKLEETIEMPFLGSNTIQGTFDYCGDYKGSLTLTDWKTSSSDYSPTRIQRNHQPYLYSALYKHKYGVLPQGVMYKTFVKSKGSIQTTYASVTQEIIDLHLNNISLIIKSMLSMVESKNYYSNYSCYNERCLNV